MLPSSVQIARRSRGLGLCIYGSVERGGLRHHRVLFTYAAVVRGVSIPTLLTAVGAGIAIWLSFGSLGITDAASGRRIGLLAPFWVLALSMAATVALFCSVTRVRQAARAVRWSLLILLPWLP